MKIAVITGATSGIGKGFVKQIDQCFDLDEIWVIARREERLNGLQKDCKTKVRPLCLDLTQNSSFDRYSQLLSELNPQIDVLVNASGYGKFGRFNELDINEQVGMLELNCSALIKLTYASIPFMVKGSQIIEVSSISAFQPVPCIAVYSATKSFVLSFSRSLSVELKSKGIGVTAVCPFWVKTEFFNRAASDDTIKYYSRFLEAEDVVRRALRDAEKGKTVSICGFMNRCQAALVKLLPVSFVLKIWCRQQAIK